MKDVKTLIECLEGCTSGRCSFCHKECQYRTNDKPIMTCEGLLKDVIECLKEKRAEAKRAIRILCRADALYTRKSKHYTVRRRSSFFC